MRLLIMVLLCASAIAQPKQVELEQDLVLGGMDAPDIALFSATAKLAVAPDGTMYVLDSGNFRISVFDATGEFQFKFGSKGKGPGEYLEPVAIAMDHEQQIWLFDTGQHKLTIFDAKGNYVSDQRFSTSIHGIYTPTVLNNGHVALTAFRIGEGFQMGYAMMILDTKSEKVAEFNAYSLPPIEWDKMEQPGFWRGFMQKQFVAIAEEMPLVAGMGDRLLVMEKNAYAGQLVDGTGKVIKSFEGSFKPRALSDEAKYALCEPIWQDLAANPALSRGLTTQAFNQALDQYELQVVPPLAAVTSIGSHFVVLQSYDHQSRTGKLDFLDGDGKLVGQADYQGTHQFLTGSNDMLYSVGYNEDEDVVITRFKVSGL